MANEPRLTITLEQSLYQELLEVTDRRRPRLTKRYVVELALSRLFTAMKGGQLELGLEDRP
jgi:hypothetical protein